MKALKVTIMESIALQSLQRALEVLHRECVIVREVEGHSSSPNEGSTSVTLKITYRVLGASTIHQASMRLPICLFDNYEGPLRNEVHHLHTDGHQYDVIWNMEGKLIVGKTGGTDWAVSLGRLEEEIMSCVGKDPFELSVVRLTPKIRAKG